jgi:hypothetical protein
MTQDQDPQPAAADPRTRAIRALLAEAAAPRERVIDDHMFTVDRDHRPSAAFRLQLFTAPGTRPVAVVIQRHGEGASVFNAAERYAEAVWQRHCPDEDAPPIWIQRFIFPWQDDDPFRIVTFPVLGPYQLGPPGRQLRITEREIALLTGTQPGTDRGSGFRPRTSVPDPEPVYEVSWVVRLPRPSPFRLPGCMPAGIPWWRRLGRQVFPQPRGRPCCWMHQGSWQDVSAAAIRLVRAAQRQGIAADDDIREYVLARARATGMTGWELDALATLVDVDDGIQIDDSDGDRFYINGQHKAQAMLEQGVRRTVTIRWLHSDG